MPSVRHRRRPSAAAHPRRGLGGAALADSGVVLADWDTCLLAPPERDLWMPVGEDPGIRDRYAARTRDALDPRLLEAYRLRWDLADVEASVRDLRAPHVDDEDTRPQVAQPKG
jgi:hypothetical protein